MPASSTSKIKHFGQPQKPRRRWGRIVLASLAGLLLVGAILIALAPTLLSTSAGVSLVNSFLDTDPARPIMVTDLDLRWSGTQRITGLTVGDGHGATLAKIDATLDGSLLSWARGSRDFGTVTVTGSANLQSAAPAPEPTAPSPAPPPEPVSLPPDLVATIRFQDFAIQYTDPLLAPGTEGAGTAHVENLNGSIDLNVPAHSPIRIDLNAKTNLAGRAGSMTLAGEISDAIAADGTLQIENANGRISGIFNDLPTGLIDALAGQQGRLNRTLGETLTLSTDANGDLISGRASVQLKSPRAELTAALEVRDSLLSVTRPLAASVHMEPATLAAWLPQKQASAFSLAEAADVDLEVSRLEIRMPRAGRLDLSGARIDAALRISPNSITFADSSLPGIRIESLDASVTSDDVTGLLKLDMNGGFAAGDSGRASPLRVDLQLERPFRPDGTLASETLGISGRIEAGDIPTPVIDSIAGQNGLLIDLLGSSIRSLVLTAAVEPGASTPATKWTLDARSDAMIARADGQLAAGRLTLGTTGASAQYFPAAPALDRINRMLGDSARVRTTGEVNLNLSRLAVTLPQEGQSALTGLSLAGVLSLSDVELVVQSSADESRPVALALPSATTEFASDDLAAALTIHTDFGARINGTAMTGGARATVRNVADSAKRSAEFTATLPELPTAAAEPWVGERMQALREAVGQAVDVEAIGTWTAGGAISATLTARNPRLTTTVRAETDGGDLMLTGSGKQTLTPALIEAVRPEGTAYALTAPAVVSWELAPMTVKGSTVEGSDGPDWAGAMRTAPMNVRISTPEVGVTGMTGLGSALTLMELRATAELPRGATGGINLALDTTISADPSQGPPQIVGPMKISATLDPNLAQPLIGASVIANEINVAAVETLLGREAGSLTGLAGATGKAAASLVPLAGATPTDGALAPDSDFVVEATFEQMSANLNGSIRSDLLTLTKPGTLSGTISKSFIEKSLAASTTSAESTTQKPAVTGGGRNRQATGSTPTRATFTVPADVRMKADLSRLSIPLQMFKSEQTTAIWSPTQLSVEGIVSLSTVSLRSSGAPGVDLQGLSMRLSGKDLAEGIQYALAGNAVPVDPSGKLGAPGQVGFVGTLQSSLPNLEQIELNGNGKLTAFPTVIIDSLAQQGGLLTGLLGATMDVTFNARNLSMSAGNADLELVSEHTDVSLPSIEIREGRAVVARESTARVDVTESMTRSILKNVNPMLYDVQKKEGPIILTIRSFAYPLDGDLSRMDGDVTLDLGQVDVPGKGLMGALLGDMAKGQPETTKALIPPINVRINKGILSYDQFRVQTAAFDIRTNGRVNLVKRELDLEAAVPLLGWQSVLGDFVKVPLSDKDLLEIPFYLTITGPIDDPKVKPDPEGVKKVTDDLIRKGLLSPLKGLEDLFKKKDN